MTVFECHNCIGLECKQHAVCDQFAREQAERLKELMMKT